jgi:predicted dehydrogenase
VCLLTHLALWGGLMPARRTGVRVAIAGYGYWGSKHVRVLSTIPDVAVTVVDPRPERRSQAAAHYPYSRVAERLDDVLEDVDAVVVATSPSSHAELASRVLQASRHVLVEKPLSTTSEDAEMLVELADQRGAILMVGHTFEYNPAVWKLRDLVRSGALGNILYVDSARLSLGRYQRDVNVIWDLAPHDISIASFVLDDVPSATAVWAQCNIGTKHADVAYLRLDFPRARTQAFVHVSWLSPNKVRRVTVVGEKMMAVYDDLSDNERIRVYDIGVDLETIDDPDAAHGLPVTYRTGDIISPFIPFQEPLLLQDDHFVDCIRNGTQPRTPGRRGLEIVRVLAATDNAGTLTRTGSPSGAGARPILVGDSVAGSHTKPVDEPSLLP